LLLARIILAPSSVDFTSLYRKREKKEKEREEKKLLLLLLDRAKEKKRFYIAIINLRERERETFSQSFFFCFSKRPSTNGNVVFLLANHILCKITINESNDNVSWQTSLSTEYSVTSFLE